MNISLTSYVSCYLMPFRLLLLRPSLAFRKAGIGIIFVSLLVLLLNPQAYADPSNLRVTSPRSASSIALAWDAPADTAGITGYNVLRCVEGDTACTPAYLAWVSGVDTTTYTDGAVTSGTTYRYAVQACSPCGNWSNEVTAGVPAAPPATLTAGTVRETTATLTIANHSVAWWYKGEQSGAQCTSVGAGTTTANLAGLTADTAYTYKAYSDSACSTELASATFTTHGIPANLRVTSRSASAIALSWDAPTNTTGITGYNVNRCDASANSSCTPAYIAWASGAAATTYTNDGSETGTGDDLTSGNTYRYTVDACYGSACGTKSNVVTVAASTRPPVFPEASYSFNLRENRVRGWQTPRDGLYATDPDGDNLAVTYALTAGNPSCPGCGIENSSYRDNLFRVATNAGKARITYQGTGEDYESFPAGAAYYTLTLTATDEDNDSASVSVRINITDVEEPTEDRPPAFHRSSYSFDLPEHQDRGWQTPRGGLYATDPDGDNLAITYALTAGNPSCQGCGIKNSPYRNNLFRVATNTGEARITYQGTGENYESFPAGAAHYTLTLRATDEDNDSVSISVRINITDVDELKASFEAGLRWYEKDAFPELSGVTAWNGVAWKGERIQQHILMKSIPSYNQVSLTAGNFNFEADGSNATVPPIPASAVSFRHPHFVKGDTEARTCAGYPDRNTSSYGTSHLSDALFSVQQRTLSTVLQNHKVSMAGTNVKVDSQPASWTVPVWMAIDIPRNTRPGTYSGTVTLSAASTTREISAATATLQVSIEVVPWTMPQPAQREFHLDLWQFPIVAFDKYNAAHPEALISLWSQDHYGLLEPFYRYLAGLGQQTVSAYAQRMIRWTKTSTGWEYDYSVFDAHVNKLASWGIDHQLSVFAIGYWREGNAGEYPYRDAVAQENKLFRADIGSSNWKQRWNHFLTDFKNHLVAEGWFDKTFLYMDEVPAALMQHIIDLVQKNDAGWKIGLAYGHAPGAQVLRELDDSSNTMVSAGARYPDDGLTTGMSYRYAVQACNSSGCGNWSDRVTMVAQTPAAPGIPTGLTATAAGSGMVRLNWTAPTASGSSSLTGYNVYRCTDSTSACTTPAYHAWSPGSASTTYTDSGLTVGTTYRYEVDACNESGCSDRTALVGILAQSLTPGGTQTGGSASTTGGSGASTHELPGAPTGLTAVAASPTAIQLIWKAPAATGSSALDGYNVYRCTGAGCTLTADDYLDWTNANERDGQTYPNQVTTFYTSCFQVRPNSFVATDSDPVEMVALPWHTLERRHDGYSRWAFDNWRLSDPLDLREGAHTAGDFSLVYRSSNDRDMTVVPSIRLEALREGMEDFEKIQVLRRSLSTCSAGGLSRRWLDRLERTVKSFNSAALTAGRASGLVNRAHTQLDEVSRQLSPNRCQ